jgi:hypothetical protein
LEQTGVVLFESMSAVIGAIAYMDNFGAGNVDSSTNVKANGKDSQTDTQDTELIADEVLFDEPALTTTATAVISNKLASSKPQSLSKNNMSVLTSFEDLFGATTTTTSNNKAGITGGPSLSPRSPRSPRNKRGKWKWVGNDYAWVEDSPEKEAVAAVVADQEQANVTTSPAVARAWSHSVAVKRSPKLAAPVVVDLTATTKTEPSALLSTSKSKVDVFEVDDVDDDDKVTNSAAQAQARTNTFVKSWSAPSKTYGQTRR